MIYSTPFKFRAPTPRTAMAQAFAGSSQHTHSQYRLTLAPYAKASISFWLNWTTFADDDRLAVEYSSNYNRNAGTFIIDPNSSAPDRGRFDVGVNTTGSPPAQTVAGFARPKAGVWNHIVATFDLSQTGAAQIPAVYVNGRAQSLTYRATAGVASNFTNHTLYLMSRAGSSLFGAGAMSDLAIFRDPLSIAQVAGRANGVDPRLVATGPLDLLYYWTMSVLRPEPNWGWNTNALIPATTAAAVGPWQVIARIRQPLLMPEMIGKAAIIAGTR
jgi:hypothetical protein